MVSTANTQAGQNRYPSQIEYLDRLISQARELLPAQGPLSAFVFINPLQALEDQPFDDAVKRGARLFGCEPYLGEDRYRDELRRGRIRLEDVRAALREDLGSRANARVCGLDTRLALRLAMLEYPQRFGTSSELRWYVAETDALQRFRPETSPEHRDRLMRGTHHWLQGALRQEPGAKATSPVCTPELRDLVIALLSEDDDSTLEKWNDRTWERITVHVLWRVCREGAKQVQHIVPLRLAPLRHRDVLRDLTAADSDLLVDDVLVRFCAAFADQGFARRPLPERDKGFFRAFCELYRKPRRFGARWQRGLAAELARIETAGMTPLECIKESLDLLGVSDDDWDDFLSATLLSLRGWAGILSQMEVRPDRVARAAPQGTLVEFLAVRLILERLALAHVARRKLNYTGELSRLRDFIAKLRPNSVPGTIEQRAFIVFQLSQLLGWSPQALDALSQQDWATLIAEIELFSSWERRRVFHQAFERQLRERALDAVSLHGLGEARERSRARLQAVFCIDAREESYRRHLEELTGEIETFGMAGFFSAPMFYRGAGEAKFSTMCPVVVTPQHYVIEDVLYPLSDAHRRRAKTRRALGMASHQVHVGSRNIAGGTLLTAGLGVLASIPLVARVLFPRLTSRIRKMCGSLVETPKLTRLWLERTAPTCGPRGDEVGFTLEEMANIGERALRDIGLTSDFARLVVFLGHGSQTMNNPHNSVYNCGACSGSAGGANARALAAMLNDHRVKAMLAKRGLEIPIDTYFLGGLHNTCSDSLTFFDLDLLPNSHRGDFERGRVIFEEGAERNAHERCRRFESAPLKLSAAEAKRHVEARSEDLAQTRPEFGNASNAICVVGRRSLTKGLYMDRRSFLHSYDPTQDDEDSVILERILSAVVPVCSGINLQYFFSYVDNTGWGCGTKLPHNVSALLGVMDGAVSDLRSGLPWQGVEIHEPVRLLMIIETTPEAMLKIMDRNALIGRILCNAWVQLAVVDHEASCLRVFRNGSFHLYEPSLSELPTVYQSSHWYSGWREHLPFATIDPSATSSLTADDALSAASV